MLKIDKLKFGEILFLENIAFEKSGPINSNNKI